MAITAFDNVTDGLDSNQRNRGHFIADAGALAACEDGFTALGPTRNYCREAGLDVGALDLLIR